MNLIRTVVLLLLVSPGLSWDWTTHQYAARQICDHLGCGPCLDYMLNGSIAPDRDFKDFVNHHCYDPLRSCPSGDWVCPEVFDCPALEKSDYWLAKTDYGCEKFYDIGVASHYYLDSRVFWHQIKSEDYESCHAKFEDMVGQRIEGDFDIWVCSTYMNKTIFNGYISEFERKLGGKTDYVLPAIITLALVLVLAVRFRK